MLNYKIFSLIAVIFSLTNIFALDDNEKCDCGFFRSIINCLIPKENLNDSASFELDIQKQELPDEFCFCNQKITSALLKDLSKQMSPPQNRALKIVSFNNCIITETINWNKYWPSIEIVKIVFAKTPNEIHFSALENAPGTMAVLESKEENPKSTTCLEHIEFLQKTSITYLLFKHLKLNELNVEYLKNFHFSLVEKKSGSLLFERKKKKFE